MKFPPNNLLIKSLLEYGLTDRDKFSLIPNNYMENIEAILNRGQVSSRDKKYILTLLNKIISDTKELINKSFKEE